MIRRCLTAAAVLALAFSASAEEPAGEGGRPHAMRVFRSVLDGRARIVTVPLHPDMWLAYDATHCGLYRAWTGDVKFDGAVYTTVHGPQPTARGADWIHDEADEVWFFVQRGSVLMAAAPRFLGYRIEEGRVTLLWELRRGATRVRIRETPSVESGGAGRVVLTRRFTVQRGRGDVAIGLRTRVRGCAAEGDVTSDASLLVSSRGTRAFEGGALHDLDVLATFPTGASSYLRTVFAKDLVVKEAEAEAAAAVAKKAAEAKRAGEAPTPAVEAHPADTPLGHGVSVRVYHVGKAMAQLRQLVPGQTPNWSHVIPVLDLRTERGDFGEGAEEFITHVDGFLEVPADGEYGFQLTSDDGSRLFLDDKVVVDHDGLHGATDMQGTAILTKGRHKLFVEHFENGGGERLTLAWRPPGAEAFTVVPNAVLRAPTGEVRVTSPGTKRIVQAAARGRPGDGRPLDGVHPAFDLMTVRPDGFEPRVGGMDWLPDGRLVICCWEPRGGVYVLDGVHGDDRAQVTVKRIAEGLAEPLGLRVVDGRLFVLQKQELTELIDHDGDGIIDEYRCVANGWGVTANFHEFAFGLVHKDDHFYATLATAIDPGGASTQPQDPDRGKVVKIAMDGSFELVAEGLRTPNGIGLGVDGEIFITDNQGDWLPVSKVLHLREGAFFGGRSVDFEGTEDRPAQLPVVWLPQGEIGNSPAEPGLCREGPYAGQMLHAEVTHGGLKRVFVEKVKGQYQGCVFRFTQGLEAGINRWTRGPDGALYVGGIGSAGNWGQSGKLKHGLQRMKHNGTSVFEMLRIRARKNGLHVDFTEPLALVAGGDPQDYLVQQWRYVPTKSYGGPKVDVEDLSVRSVTRSADARSVFLDVPGLKEGHVLYVRLARTVRTQAGVAPWSTEAWYTLNRLPDEEERLTPRTARAANTLTARERDAGWKLLFDGKTCEQWRGFKKDALPSAWSARDGALVFDPTRAGRGDIVTKESFTNFELDLEWRVAENGNSGIMFHVSEEHGAPWATGPEMQILDNAGHPDGRATLTSAGSNYALHAPRVDVSRPSGRWNRARLLVDGTHVEHWLNGWKLLEYELGSDDWKALVAKSKFASMAAYGTTRRGHIALQDHGDRVAFRNIRIRTPAR